MSGTAVTRLPPIESRSLPSPHTIAHHERPVLPPIYRSPDPVGGVGYPPGNVLYIPGRVPLASQLQREASLLPYHQQTFREPAQVPWGGNLTLERPFGYQQRGPSAARNVQPPNVSAEAPHSASASRIAPQAFNGSTRASSVPISMMPEMRPPAVEATRSRVLPAMHGVPDMSRQRPAVAPVAYGSLPMPSVQLTTPNTPQENDITSRYILRVRQQPVAARACGFGERDRRVIDPPPVVQLSLADYDPQNPGDVEELRNSLLVVHCHLLSAASQSSRTGVPQDVTAVPEPNDPGRLTRKLTGTLVASQFVGTDVEAPASSDENARLGCFFLFPDLSCRQVGRYRLSFTIMKMGPQTLVPGSNLPALGTVESQNFEVYSAKEFPGMRASSDLIKDLKRQGASVSVKKGNEGSARRRNQRRGSSLEEEDRPGSSLNLAATPRQR